MSTYHIAQLNLAVPRFPLDDPRMTGFMSMLDDINAIADESPGFEWRLVADGANDATSLRTTCDGIEQMINMSVWSSRVALRNYVYRSDHLGLLRQRSDWFAPPSGPTLVLWWVPASHIPAIDEGLDRLDALRRNGPSPDAFTFREPFDAPGS